MPKGQAGLLWIWLALAAVAVLHALAVGGGIATPALLWLMDRNGGVDETETILLVGAVAVVPPAVILAVRAARARRARPTKPRPFTPSRKRITLVVSGISAASLLALCALAVIRFQSLPGRGDPLQRVVVDETPASTHV